MKASETFPLVKQAAIEWIDDNAPTLGAARGPQLVSMAAVEGTRAALA
ncbi:MAG: hypothetical protein WCF18_23455 [Chthoniobacteraceae bacterium]